MNKRHERLGKSDSLYRLRAVRWTVAVAAAVFLAAGCDLAVSTDSKVTRAEKKSLEGDYAAAMADLRGVLEDSPDHAAARLVLGDVAQRTGDDATAIKELDRAAALGADPAAVGAIRYRALLSSGKYAELLQALDKDTALQPAPKATLRGSALAGLGRTEEAASSFAAALELAPDDSSILIAYARFLAASRQWDAATEAVNKALEISPESADGWALHGMIEFLGGRLGPARASLVKALDLGHRQLSWPEQFSALALITEVDLGLQDTAAAGKSLNALRARWPDHPGVDYLAARLAMSNKDYKGATEGLRKALQKDPGNPAMRLMLGASLLASGQLEQAKAELSSLFYQHPDNIEARKLLAQVYLVTNRATDARDLLSGADEALDDDSRLQWMLGAALMQTGSEQAGLERLEKGIAADPGNVAMRLDLATIYVMTGRRDEARKMLEAVPAGEGGARLRGLLVLAAARGASPAQAMAEVETLVRDRPDDPLMLANAGLYMVTAANDVQRGREWLTRSLSLDPNQPGARFALAALDMQEGNADAAEKQLKAVLEADPRNERAYLALTQNALARGDTAQAATWLEQSIGSNPQAVESRLHLARLRYIAGESKDGRALLDQAVTVASAAPETLTAAGNALMSVGQYEEALVFLRRAVEGGSQPARLNAARAHWALGQKEQARQLLSAGLTADPKWVVGLSALCDLHVREGQIDRALNQLREARKSGVAPDVADMIEGDVQLLAERPREAAILYARAAARTPSSILAIKQHLARKAAGLDQPAEPLVHWLQQSPEDVSARRLLAGFYLETGQRRPAIAEYELLVGKVTTLDAVSLNNLAWLYNEARDPRALATADKARRLAPASPAVLDTYGWILLANDRAAEARSVLETAHRGQPENAEIRYHLAEAYARTGSPDKALEQLKAALATKGEEPWRSDAEQLLSQLRK